MRAFEPPPVSGSLWKEKPAELRRGGQGKATGLVCVASLALDFKDRKENCPRLKENPLENVSRCRSLTCEVPQMKLEHPC